MNWHCFRNLLIFMCALCAVLLKLNNFAFNQNRFCGEFIISIVVEQFFLPRLYCCKFEGDFSNKFASSSRKTEEINLAQIFPYHWGMKSFQYIAINYI